MTGMLGRRFTKSRFMTRSDIGSGPKSPLAKRQTIWEKNGNIEGRTPYATCQTPETIAQPTIAAAYTGIDFLLDLGFSSAHICPESGPAITMPCKTAQRYSIPFHCIPHILAGAHEIVITFIGAVHMPQARHAQLPTWQCLQQVPGQLLSGVSSPAARPCMVLRHLV